MKRAAAAGRFTLTQVVGAVVLCLISAFTFRRINERPPSTAPTDSLLAAPYVMVREAADLKAIPSFPRDERNPNSIAVLDHDVRAMAESLLDFARANGIRVYVSSAYRSWERQADLYRNRHRNPYPVAPPGRSLHQLGRAFDIWVCPPRGWTQDEALRFLGMRWEELGGRWGGRFRDPIHFEA